MASTALISGRARNREIAMDFPTLIVLINVCDNGVVMIPISQRIRIRGTLGADVVAWKGAIEVNILVWSEQ